MFSWGTKKEQGSLRERLDAATKKTRADLALKMSQITSNAQKASLEKLSEHSSTKTEAVCTLNFEDPKFVSKINGFNELTMDQKVEVINNVKTYIEDGGVKTFLTGAIITVEWLVDTAKPVESSIKA